MYTPFHQEEVVSFKFPWEPNTARGFFYACCFALLLLLIFAILQISPGHEMHDVEPTTVPIELMNFGDGDGSGLSKGNLSREGRLMKGSKPEMNLESTSIAAQKANSKPILAQDPTQSANLKPIDKFTSNASDAKNATGSDAKTVGNPLGAKDGTGMGLTGTGPGFGWGLGNIDWGGGGGRRPSKDKLPMPNYKPGGNLVKLEIKVDILVDKDGMTRILRFSQKGNPELENAIEKALKQWTFNKIDKNVVQKGTVTFIFKSN
jgi:hypothetical protein